MVSFWSPSLDFKRSKHVRESYAAILTQFYSPIAYKFSLQKYSSWCILDRNVF